MCPRTAKASGVVGCAKTAAATAAPSSGSDQKPSRIWDQRLVDCIRWATPIAARGVSNPCSTAPPPIIAPAGPGGQPEHTVRVRDWPADEGGSGEQRLDERL